MSSFLHGVETKEFDTGLRPIALADSSVIGLIGTAADADAALFPLDTPVLVSGSRAEAAGLGAVGTLPAAIDAIFDQAGARIVVVRVDDGVDAAATLANVIGYSKATGGASNGTSINATVDVENGDLVFALTGALFPNGGTTGVLNLGATTTVSLTGDNQKMYAAAEVQSAAGSRDVVTTFGGSVNYPGTATLAMARAGSFWGWT